MTASTGARAIVIGGSLGGLIAANLLLRAGWRVDVYERVGEALAGRGAGVVTHEELFRALERAGVRIDDSVGVRVERRVAFDRDGSVLGEQPMVQVLTAWGRLYRLLKDALPAERYHFGRELQHVEQDERSVTARFAGGGSETGELLVAADGIRSTVRAQMLPEARPVYAGYVAWRGLAGERSLCAATHAALFEKFGFCLPPGEQMLGYPVAGPNNSTEPGKRRYNFVWYRPADEKEALPGLLTDDAGRRYEHSIPPDRIRAEVIGAMRRDAEALLAPQFAEVVRDAALPLLQPIFDLESARLAFGRVAIIGDAAFVARPHCGMGVTKAAGDAVAMLNCLAAGDDVPSALRAYEAARRPFGTFVVGHARHLGEAMRSPGRAAAESTLAGRVRAAEFVMSEIAVDLPA